MPKKWKVDEHPKKTQIIRALTRGTSFRKISERFGIPQTSLHSYLHQRLIEVAAKAKIKRDLADGNLLLDELDAIMGRAQKLFDACDEWLLDPTNPERYELGPRGTEIDVVYVDSSGEKPVVLKRRLQDLLDDLGKKGMPAVEIKFRHADPRKLILEAANSLKGQLELLARIQGTVKDVTVNVHYEQFQAVILALQKVAAQHPEVKPAIIAAMERLRSSDR